VELSMCTTATAKRRRRQSKLNKGRKVTKLDRKAMMIAARKK